MRKFFVAADGRLYLGWRLFTYTFLLFVVLMVAQGFGRRGGQIGPTMLYAAVYIGGALLLTYLFRRRVDRRPWEGMALPSLWRRLPDFLTGYFLGAAMLGAVVGVAYLAGWVSVTGSEAAATGWASALGYILAGFFATLPDGVCEELMMRGYWFQNLAERWPVWLATTIMGTGFGLLHFSEYAPTLGFLVFVTNAVVISSFLILTRLVTGSLWFGIGWHAAWNWAQGSLLGISVLTFSDRHPLLKLERHGPTLFLGGSSTPEAGLLSLGVDLLGVLLLLAWARVRHRPLAWQKAV